MLADDQYIFMSGTTGFDYETMEISRDFEEQVRQTCKTVAEQLKLANSSPEKVILCNWIITDRKYFELGGKLLREFFLGQKPVMMTLVCDLIDQRMLFEMQVIAKR